MTTGPKTARGLTTMNRIIKAAETEFGRKGYYNTGINDLLISALVLAFGKSTGEHSLAIDLEGHGRDDMAEDADHRRDRIKHDQSKERPVPGRQQHEQDARAHGQLDARQDYLAQHQGRCWRTDCPAPDGAAAPAM